MKKIVLFIWCSLITVTSLYADVIKGGFQPKLRGYYNNKLDDFKKDLVAAHNNNATGDLFQDPAFVDSLVLRAQIESGDPTVTLQDIIDEGVDGGAPTGFIASINATHEMCVWNASGTKIAGWGSRNPYKGERFLWFRGKCIMSLYCGNFVRQKNVTTLQENSNQYVFDAAQPAKKQLTAGSTTINLTVNGANAYATGGSSSVSQPATGGDDDEVIFDTRPRRRASSGYVDDGVIRTQEMQNTSQKVLNWTGSAVNLATAYAILRPPVQRFASYNVNENYSNVIPNNQPQQQIHYCRMGHANCINPHQQQQQVRCCRLGHPNCTNPHLGNGGNGGGANRYNWSPPGQP